MSEELPGPPEASGANPYAPGAAHQTVLDHAPPFGALWRGYFWTLVAAAVMGLIAGPFGVIVGISIAGTCGVLVFAAGAWFLRVSPTSSVLIVAALCGAFTGFSSLVLPIVLLSLGEWTPQGALVTIGLSVVPAGLGAAGGGFGAWYALRGQRTTDLDEKVSLQEKESRG